MTLEDFRFQGPTPVQNSLRDAEIVRARADTIERWLQAISDEVKEVTGHSLQEAHDFWARVLENDTMRDKM